MGSESFDRNLLFGMLALQNGFVSKDEMLTAFRELANSSSDSMRSLLCEQESLTDAAADALDSLVKAHLQRNGDDSQASLTAMDSLDFSLRKSIEEAYSINGTASNSKGDSDSFSDQSHADLPTFALTMSASVGAPTKNGRFQILRPYAKGGLGEVFVARDEELDREVALKQIRGDASGIERRERFVREAEITGKLEHPGIVPIYGLGADKEGNPYYAMRFIRGQSFRDAIKTFHSENNQSRSESTRNKEFRKLLGWFNDVCYAISYAHSRGVLHRDIKPSNVMIGQFGETLVVDWGLARVAGVDDNFESTSDEKPLKANLSGFSSNTMEGQTVGTPAYMSPEQASGRLDQLGPQSDVYCLGATLFALMVGKAPHTGNPDSVIKRVSLGQIPKPSEMNQAVPKALEAVCLRAMALKPKDRYATAIDLAHDIEAWLADEPVDAWDEPFTYRARRWVQRNQTAVFGSAIGVIALAGAAIVASVLLSAKNGELQSASETIQLKNTALITANENETEARERADRVKEYLVNTFQRADPSEDGRALTLAQLLDSSVEKIEQDLAGDPLIQADLYSSIGQSYLGLGLYQEAKQSYLKELAVRQKNQPQDDIQLLRAGYRVALSLWRLSNYPEAIEIVTETLMAQEAQLGKKHNDTLNSMNLLAICYQAQGKAKEATKLFTELVELRTEVGGPDDDATLMALNNLASAYQRATRYTDANELYVSTLEKQRVKNGEQHANTLLAKESLASNLRQMGDFKKAIELFNEVVEARKTSLGESHPRTLGSINNLVLALQDDGQYEQTVPLIQTVLDKNIERFGETHIDTLRARNTLGMALIRTGKTKAAIPVFEETLPAFEAKHGIDNVYTMSVVNNLAYAYLSNGEYAKSIPLFKRAYDSRLADLGATNSKTILSFNNWALAIRGSGDLATALPMLEKSYLLWQEKEGVDHHNTLSSARILGTSLRTAGELERSKQVLEETRLLQIKDQSEDHPNTLYTNVSLVETLRQLNQTEEALELIEKTLATMKDKLGEKHPQTLAATRVYGEVLIAQDRTKEAVDLLGSALEIMRTEIGIDHPKTLKTLATLARAHADNGNADDAMRFFKSAIERQSKKLGDSHPQCLKTRIEFARFLLEEDAMIECESQLRQLWDLLPSQADHNLLPVEIENRKTVVEMFVGLFAKLDNQAELKKWQAKLELK